MENVYLFCALAGGTLLVFQVLLALVGLGEHHGFGAEHDFSAGHEVGADHDVSHEVNHDHASSLFVGLLTFRTVVAALTFFGLAGLAAHAHNPDEPAITLGIALAAGAGALLLVASMMKALNRLRADGTERIDRAVGRCGTVYLTIPARKEGAGKVTMSVQNRTVEYRAVTPEESLPTGARVRVVSVVGPGTVEVVPDNPERTTHV
jgi:hypothetical protein